MQTDKTIMRNQVSSKFDRFVILINPASTGIRQAQRRVSELHALFPDIPMETIITNSTSREANANLLCSEAAQFGPRTLLCVAAGDGTTNMVVETLMQDKRLSAESRRTPILPLWGGNANDLACMLNGQSRIIQLRTIFESGQVTPIRPLCCRVIDKDGSEQKHIAACYIGFGATANVAKRLNEPQHRLSTLTRLPGGRLLQDASTAWNALIKSPIFVVEEAGNIKTIYERTFSNGSRFAKVYHMPVRLSDNYFYSDTLESRGTVASASRISFAFRRRLYEKSLHSHSKFTICSDTLAHFDGEAIKIPSGADIDIRLSSIPFFALSVNLP